MKENAKVPEDFVYQGPNGIQVRFGLAYDCKKDPSLPPRFELRMEGPDPWSEQKRVFESELDIEVHAHGHLEQLRWYADCRLKNGKPLEIGGSHWSYAFRGRSPSFWPTDRTEWKVTDLTPEGYRISVPPYSLQNLRVEFFPRQILPPQEVDL